MTTTHSGGPSDRGARTADTRTDPRGRSGRSSTIIGREAVEYLASQLPEGYALDGEHRVVRTDPALPDHVDIRSLVFGKPGPLVRVPVYK